MTILIVEDEAATRRGLASVIRHMDCEKFQLIGEAENGFEGMRMIYDLHPDIAITDIRMPRVNGLDMIENAMEGSPSTRFIIMSGYAEFEYAQKAVKLPVVDYLLKPVTKKELADILEAVYERLAGEEKTSGDPPEEQIYSPQVMRLIEAVRQDYARKIRIEDYAKQLKLTPEYLGALFAKETGKSFCCYLRDVRMERAKTLLLTTDDKIYEVAYKTGYPDPKYFCKVFKEYTGVSAKSFAAHQSRS